MRFVAGEAQSGGTDPVWVEDAPFRFVVLGSESDGSHLWISGSGHVDADFVPEQGWRFSRFGIDGIDEYQCPGDLFQTPAEPAH